MADHDRRGPGEPGSFGLVEHERGNVGPLFVGRDHSRSSSAAGISRRLPAAARFVSSPACTTVPRGRRRTCPRAAWPGSPRADRVGSPARTASRGHVDLPRLRDDEPYHVRPASGDRSLGAPDQRVAAVVLAGAQTANERAGSRTASARLPASSTSALATDPGADLRLEPGRVANDRGRARATMDPAGSAARTGGYLGQDRGRRQFSGQLVSSLSHRSGPVWHRDGPGGMTWRSDGAEQVSPRRSAADGDRKKLVGPAVRTCARRVRRAAWPSV